MFPEEEGAMNKAATIALALILVASSAWAQASKNEAQDSCGNPSIFADTRIKFCTQLIESDSLPKEKLPPNKSRTDVIPPSDWKGILEDHLDWKSARYLYFSFVLPFSLPLHL